MIIIQDKKFWAKLFLVFLFLLVVCPSSLGKISQLSSGEDGIEIKIPQQDYIKQNQNIKYNFHIFNKSNGLPLNENNAFCTIHLYNQTGSHIYIENITTTEYTWDFAGDISGGNFSTSGLYSYIVQCNNSNYGGFISSAIIVNLTGKEPPTDFVKVFFILLFVLILGLVTWTTLLLIKYLEQKDMDLIDLMYYFGVYFIVFSTKYFNIEYMGSAIIDRFSDLFITVGRFSHIGLPAIVFIVCFMKRRLEIKEEDV